MSKFMWNDPGDRAIIAFVHIEKAAGTTLTNIFRREFSFRFGEVRPLELASGKEFTAEDMRKSLMVNPFLTVIAGHAVKPFSGLLEAYNGIKYVTLLRDPVKRYVSHYQYWIEKMGRKLHFEQFLTLENMWNFQTRKIAGLEDVQSAKEILAEKFLLVGFVEQFDEFVAMLNEASPYKFSLAYNHANKAKSRELADALLVEYREEILKRNKLDIELTDFVKEIIIPKQRLIYPDYARQGLPGSKSENNVSASLSFSKYVYYLYKKLYFEPVTGLVRRFNGLPARGSYAIPKKNIIQ